MQYIWAEPCCAMSRTGGPALHGQTGRLSAVAGRLVLLTWMLLKPRPPAGQNGHWRRPSCHSRGSCFPGAALSKAHKLIRTAPQLLVAAGLCWLACSTAGSDCARVLRGGAVLGVASPLQWQ